MWTVLLGGPVVGTVYFMAVYLAAEAACSHGVEGFGTGALRAFILAATAASAGILAAAALAATRLHRRAARERADDGDTGPVHRFAATTGLMLGGLFGFFVLLVAAPVVGSSLC